MAAKFKAPIVHETEPPGPIRPLHRLFARFTSLEASGGIVLLAMTVVAMAWANSPWADTYHRLWLGTTFTIGVPGWLVSPPLAEMHQSLDGFRFIQGQTPTGGDRWPAILSMPLLLWINDGLMAIFFFLIGLEIKREVLVGELRTFRKAALPVAAAIGGMVVPAALFASINRGLPTIRGWGIPVATDIAFALGVLALLGNRVPASLRIFLATLAIADDIGALLVIAVFYTHGLSPAWLGAGAACLGGLALLNRLGVRRAAPYALLGVLLWFAVLKSGVHATIAGVLAAATIPVRARVDVQTFAEFISSAGARLRALTGTGPVIASPEQQALVQSVEDACDKVQTPLEQLEHALAPLVAFVILPVFALANAGITFGPGWLGSATGRVSLGVGAGLLLGKPIGVGLASWLAVKLRVGELPAGVRLAHVHGVAWLTGIGFTMSLFIAHLAYGESEHLSAAKMGVIGASTLAAVIGLALLASAGPAGAAPRRR